MDVQYFIDKFEAIPEDRWCVNKLLDEQGKCCANGHCGVRATGRMFISGLFEYKLTEEAAQLEKVFSNLTVHDKNGNRIGTCSTYPGLYSRIAASINNGQVEEYRQYSPKQRILAALRDVQTLEQQDKAVLEAKEVLAQETELV